MKLSTRLIAASAVVVMSGATWAQSTASMHISGQVGVNCTIGVKPTAKASSLDLVKGESNTQIADVIENCNNPTGYTVTLSSEMGGRLQPKFDGAEPVAYDLSYEKAEGSIAEKMVAFRDTAEFDRVAPLSITLPGNSRALAGYYYDNIVLTIAAK